jgi:nicotinamide-nucleotide amidase
MAQRMKRRTMKDSDWEQLGKKAGKQLTERGWMLATAESCTGGWVAQVVTSVAGSSQWFDRGFVTYSNQAKQEMLGVPAAVLEEFGAVSEETVIAMAQGAVAHSEADVALAVSGVAGPGGGSEDKPVGTVHFAWAAADGSIQYDRHLFSGDRQQVRGQAVQAALEGLIALLEAKG